MALENTTPNSSVSRCDDWSGVRLCNQLLIAGYVATTVVGKRKRGAVLLTQVERFLWSAQNPVSTQWFQNFKFVPVGLPW